MKSCETNGKLLEYTRYYIRGSVMEVEEDRTHEFKGHRNIAIEEIPPWCVDMNDKNRKTRNCISRNICGFLNSGLGGTVYLGVLDSGEVEGLSLTRYQSDHIKLSLKDTLQRFRPPVPMHLVSLKFVPCIDKSDITFRQMAKSLSCTNPKNAAQTRNEVEDEKGGGWDWAVEQNNQIRLPKEIKFKNDMLRRRPHTLQTYRYCWCDDDAYSRSNHGHKSPVYVVEIIIKPPSAKDPEIRKYLNPSSELYIQPIFQAEDGSIYIRRHASLARRSLHDMVNEAVEDVQHRYFPILKEAEVQLGILQALIKEVEFLELENKESDRNKT